MDKIGVVVPTNRPEEMVKWHEAWADTLAEAEANIYVVEDKPEVWDYIKSDLGKNSWVIPCKTDCIRSYGFLQALRDGCDITITLDDDVRPIAGKDNPILQHAKWLNTYVEPDDWVRTLRYGPITRGLPEARRVVINHGLWDGIPDVSAKTQLAGYSPFIESDPRNEMIVPKGQFYPMSGMNLGFRTNITNIMYFGLQGHRIDNTDTRWGLDRCGDILAGVLSKVVIDGMYSAAIHSGEPYVMHQRASDPIKNLELEKVGEFVPFAWSIALKGVGPYRSLANTLFNMKVPSKEYCKNMAEAMRIWWELCKKG